MSYLDMDYARQRYLNNDNDETPVISGPWPAREVVENAGWHLAASVSPENAGFRVEERPNRTVTNVVRVSGFCAGFYLVANAISKLSK